jgi:hypothetical protein
LGGVKDLIEDPGSDQQSEDKALIGKADEHGKNEYVGQGLDELPVVHRAHPGNETQETGQDWMSVQASQVGFGGAGLSGKASRQAGFTVDHAPYGSNTGSA